MKQLHINDLLAVYEQYKAGTLETKTDKALLMLSLLRLSKAEKKYLLLFMTYHQMHLEV